MAVKTNLEQALDSIKRIGSFSEGEKIALIKGLRLSLFPGNWSLDSVANDDVLQYNSTTGLWENTQLVFPEQALNDLSDVSGTPSTDDVLTYSGAGWEPVAPLVTSVNAYTGDVILDATDVTPTSLKGDLLVDDGTEVTYIGVGTDGQVLEADSSESTGVKWATPASGFADPMTTIGDLIFKNGSNVTTRLPVGTNGQVLTVDAGNVSWENSATGFTDPMTTRGDIIFKDSSGVTTRLAAGTIGQILTSDGTDISWDDAPSGGGSTDFVGLTDTPANYTGSANQWVKVNAGATGLEFAAASPVTQVTGTSPVVSSGGTTPAISMPAAASGVSGYMSSTLWSKLNGIENGADVTDSTNVESAGAWMGNITISSSNPSGGSDGDIWIEIS